MIFEKFVDFDGKLVSLEKFLDIDEMLAIF